jgi:hypothetical protein
MPDLEKQSVTLTLTPNISKEIGKYHQNKQNWKEAIRYYELANEKKHSC